MPKQIYISGQLVPPEEAKISVYDHGLLYGDGVFEGLRAYNGTVFRMQEHIIRLFESAVAIYLEIPLSPAEFSDAIDATIKANDFTDCYIRAIVTRGSGTLGLDPNRCSNPQVIIIADSISLYPDDFYTNGLEIVTVSVIRNHPDALHPKIKSLNYLNNILAKVEGLAAGCIEALMLNHKGEVSECTGDNIFLVKDGVLLTPSPKAGILEGVTRGAVIELALKAGYKVEEPVIKIDDVYNADECFLTGTAAEVIPVVRVDGRRIGNGTPGAISKKLKASYHALAMGE